MNKFIKLLEYIYYSIIIYFIVLFITIMINITANKIFPQYTDKYIFVEMFTIWFCLSVMLYYIKDLIEIIPNPFTYSNLRMEDYNVLMTVILIPMIISHGSHNLKKKTENIYNSIDNYFN